MIPSRWKQIEELHKAALEQEPAQRTAFLTQACQGDDGLRQAVESLLAQYNRGGLLDRRAVDLLDSTATRPPLEVQFGPYKLEQLLGSGGMGDVYRALDTRLGRAVAIKVLRPELAADPTLKLRFMQEARAVSALNHPNIVTLYDVSTYEGTDYLVMEYIDGRTLKDLIPSEGLALEQVMEVGRQLASALGAAHAAGIIHRDIKPANILVTHEQQVKVLDFGLARLPRDEAANGLTGVGVVMGTVSYMSPEQTRGEKVDARSDIFSLGCVLYYASTGQLPFRGASALDVMHAIATLDPPLPSSLKPGLPASFDALVAKCLRKASEERFSSMTELRSGLEQRGSTAAAPVYVASIAVLPLAITGAGPDTEHFGDGLAEELIGALNKLGKIRVAPRSSAFSFRGQTKDVREVGRILNVASVLEGSLRSSGRRLRINVQLIRVADGSALWSERFDRELTDIFEVQDEIAAAVVGKLRGHLLGEPFEEPPPAAKRFTEDPEAYSLYLKGRYHWVRRPAGTHAAIEYFQQALQRDPRYALAYASLADCYNTLGSWEAGILAPEDAYSKGRAYAERSLQLDPNLAEGHCALGYGLLHFAWDLRAAERSFTAAIQLNPGYGPAIHWYAHLLSAAERFEEALERSRQYLRLDPSDPFAVTHLSWHWLMENDFATAEREGRAAVNQEPGFGWHHVFLGWGLLASGLLEEACSEIEKGTRLNGGVTVCENFAAHANAIAGRRDAALAQLDQLKQISQNKYVSPYEIGLIHEALGDRDEAFRQWELAFEQRSPWLLHLAREPRLMHLRGQPQFDALVARIDRIMYRDTKRL
jgi:eukaryotic-like serine/threonine-protein kinase